ncbi:MAG: flagellar basal body-associated FliL family protein [Spirochaetes bacterium]|nr:flagellar basal body-associated FliL family protein [Spirochaetota bacterium]
MGDDEKKTGAEDEIEEPAGEEEEGGAEKPKGPRAPFTLSPLIIRILTIALGVVVVIIVATVTAILVVSANAGNTQAKHGVDDELVKEEPPSYFDMDEFNLNTSDTDVPHFVKVKIRFAYQMKFEKDFVPELGKWKNYLRDTIGTKISEKKYNELQDPEMRKELKEEIRNEINKRVKNGEVSEVLFDDFLLN